MTILQNALISTTTRQDMSIISSYKKKKKKKKNIFPTILFDCSHSLEFFW